MERLYASLTRFVEGKLRFKGEQNKEKSKVGWPGKLKFLGFSFYPKKGEMGIRISSESLKRFRQELKLLFRQGRGRNTGRFIQEQLNPLLRGWLNYYRFADMKKISEELDEWIRRRLRLLMWRQWKRRWTRRCRLIAAGLQEERAVQSSFNDRGPLVELRCQPHESGLP